MPSRERVPQLISSQQFSLQRSEFDRSVGATPAISHFCSSYHWITAAHAHFHKDSELLILRDRDHWLTFSQGAVFGIPCAVHPMEAAWCFACPLIGKRPSEVVALLMRHMPRLMRKTRLMILGGVPRESEIHLALRDELVRHHKVQLFPGVDCIQASLQGGIDGFLSRRSGRFRNRLRRDRRRNREAGVDFYYCCRFDDVATTCERVLNVEQRSWKFADGQSVFQLPDHAAFYRQLMEQCGRENRLRAVFARHESRDIGYAVGGLLGNSYRGLQMGFDDRYRELGLGHQLQFSMIEGLAEEGIGLYDLGMDIEYKRQWGERLLRLVNFLVVRT